VDKMTIAALDAVLADHERGQAEARVPVLRMLAAGPDDIRRRSESLAQALRAREPRLDVALRDGASAVGGGAAPDVEIPTTLVALAYPDLAADCLATRLRLGRPPVVARVAEGRLVLDLRTVQRRAARSRARSPPRLSSGSCSRGESRSRPARRFGSPLRGLSSSST
jgi:L-seryl-tRNA(Ser) seleniumtransferase